MYAIRSYYVDQLKTVIATGSIESAMKVRESWAGQKMVLLFSTEGEFSAKELEEFERLIG